MRFSVDVLFAWLKSPPRLTAEVAATITQDLPVVGVVGVFDKVVALAATRTQRQWIKRACAHVLNANNWAGFVLPPSVTTVASLV